MREKEENLQHLAEQGIFDPESADGRAYRELFGILEKEPPFGLPENFSDNVIARIKATEKKSSSFGEYFWLGAGIFLLLIAMGITLALLNYRFDMGFMKGLSGYKGVLIFGSIFIAILNLFEKKLLHRQTPST